MASDALLIGESWLSEHFFSTDAKSESFGAEVTNRIKLWKEIDADGGVSARERLRSARRSLLEALIAIEGEASGPGNDSAQRLRSTYIDLLLCALGAEDGFRELQRTGPVRILRVRGVDEPVLAYIEATPVTVVDDLLPKDAVTLLEPFQPADEPHPIESASRLLSHLFLIDRVPYALVIAGRHLLLTDRERWPEGRYLAVDLQLVLERNDTRPGGEFDRATAVLAAESFDTNGLDNSGTPWWTSVIEASKRHSVGVSDDLREGVRLSIEIIANEVVRRRRERGLEPLPQESAQPLAVEALRYLYRILFLLYAEASPELEVLPVGAPEYAEGYSIDRLRDLALVRLDSDRARHSTHLYESLEVLFELVDRGHSTRPPADHLIAGLEFNSLRADLFTPNAIARIAEVGLGDEALQRVLEHLLLSKSQRGRDRGFISYSDLGINQLGAVYEGLMSYSGFFAEDDLYEVAKGGDARKGSWVVPTHRADHLAETDFVMSDDPITGERKKVVHRKGAFVYRLSGRARQQSASYYTPAVLTRFVVSQALAELLDQDGTTTTADEILELTVCEPALGSGAFAIEATRQLAEEYLRRKQAELGEPIDPEEYPNELQRVKAYIALHQVYGVDLNATAVELAEISLWLDTMSRGLDAPWFGLHLRRGNSLIGARHALYRPDQLKKRGWLTVEPTELSLTTTLEDMRSGTVGSEVSGRIFHFLLPGEGWAAAADAKEVKELAPNGTKAMREWRKRVQRQLTTQQEKRLVGLSMRVETLWQYVVRRLQIAEREVRRDITVFGHDVEPTGGAVTREEIEAKLADPNGAYRRLRRVMDAWAALWFWPVPLDDEDSVAPPSIDEWLDALTAILGTHTEITGKKAKFGQTSLGLSNSWVDLGESEQLELQFAAAKPIDEVLNAHPWLRVTEQVAGAQGFFHWELDFAALFATRGGFDLQVGNPPWVRPRTDTEALLAEGDPWWTLHVKATQATKARKRTETLARPGLERIVIDGTIDVLGTSAFVGSQVEYAPLAKLQPDLYRCFMVATWRHLSPSGISSLVHPDTHFTDVKAGKFRAATYLRLRRHWMFHNELRLFPEVHNELVYAIHIYGVERRPSFLNAVDVFHPETIESSLRHDGSGPEPGLKDDDGNWDLRPHRARITEVDDDVLRVWRDFFGDKFVSARETAMVYTVNSSLQHVLESLANLPRIGELELESSRGWDESIDRAAGRFDVEWGAPASWDDVILQGPHLHVANPFFKSPNESMKHNRDWTPVDLERLEPDAIPVTSYRPSKLPDQVAAYPRWGGKDPRTFYRAAWRRMGGPTAERTLIGTLIPPGAAHTHLMTSIASLTMPSIEVLALSGQFSSIVSDWLVRIVPKSDIYLSTLERLPKLAETELFEELVWRTARLMCLTAVYGQLWKQVDVARRPWALTTWWNSAQPLEEANSSQWDVAVPLRLDAERRQALLEIDAIVAVSMGISADELCTIYRTQFPVLRGYDRTKYIYDINGRQVPSKLLAEWRKRGDSLTSDQCYVENDAGNLTQYELPFRTLDREAEMREAHAYFSAKLAAAESEQQ